MGFYDLSKQDRVKVTEKINRDIINDLNNNSLIKIQSYFSNDDTYIRKLGYTLIGKIYFTHESLRQKIISVLKILLQQDDFRIRQTVINAAGEIGRFDFNIVKHFFDIGLFDKHHAPRNAVIGSIKKMGQKNPKHLLKWAKTYLHHPDKEIRREVCHGIELRGRTHPQDILPLLRELEYDKTARVRNTLIHVLGQISYKKGCLETVIADLKSWNNKQLVESALREIVDVHERYKNFAVKTSEEAKKYIKIHCK